MANKKKSKNTTIEIWATDLLLEAQAIVPCPEHGYMRLRHSHHAVDYALDLTKDRKLSGTTRKDRIAAVEHALDGLGDTCPACD